MTMGTAAYETYALEDLVVQPSNKMQRLSEDTSVNNLTILNMSDGTVYDTILLVNCVLTVAGNIANDGTLRINSGNLISTGTTEISGSGTTEIRANLGNSSAPGGSFVIGAVQTLDVTGAVYADVSNNGTIRTKGDWVGQSADNPLTLVNSGTIDNYAISSRFINVSIENTESGVFSSSSICNIEEGSSISGGTLAGSITFQTGDGEASISNLRIANDAGVSVGSGSSVKASGTLVIDSAFSNGGTLYANGVVSLEGSGSLVNGNGASLGKKDWSDSGSFVIGSGFTVTGGGSIYGDMVNNGVIHAENSASMGIFGKSMEERSSLVNNGEVRATGNLLLRNVRVDNGSGVLRSSGGTFQLDDGTLISGGVLDGSFALSLAGGNAVQLENVTITANSTVNTGPYSSTAYLAGTIAKECSITLSSTFAAVGDALITGAGGLNLAGGNLGSADWSDSGRLIFDAQQNVTGYGKIYGDLVNYGQFRSTGIQGIQFAGKNASETLLLENNGVISGGEETRFSVSFENTSIVNNGTLSGGGSYLDFRDSVTINGGTLTGALDFNSSAGTQVIGATFANASVIADGSGLNGAFSIGDNVSIYGGSISGTMTVNGSLAATSVNTSGAEIVFAVSAPEQNVLIQNLSEISGGRYLVRLPESAAIGSYRLAGGASAFNSAITVTDSYGTALGNVTLDSGLTVQDRFYSISVVNGTLSLHVSGAEDPGPGPVGPDPVGPDLTKDLSVSVTNKSYKAKFSWGKAALEKGEKLQGYEVVLDGVSLGYVKSTSYSTKTPLSVGTHTVMVRAVNRDGEAGSWYEESFVLQDVTAPQGKMKLSTNFFQDGAGVPMVDLSWDPATDNVGVTKYVVSYGSGKEMISTETTGTSLRISNVAGKMTFQVSAYDAAGNQSKVSRKTQSVPDLVAPDTVQNLRAEVDKKKYKATLSWDAALDNGGTAKAAGYYVTYGKEADFSDGIMKKSSRTSLSVSGLEANTTYYYKVVAYDKAGNESAVGQTASFYVKDLTAPSGKMKVVAEAKVENGQQVVDLRWNAAEDNIGVTKYLVEYGTGRNLIAYETTETGFRLPGTVAGKLTVQIRAYDAAGNESRISKSTVTIADKIAPDVVQNLNCVQEESKYKATLTWDESLDNGGTSKASGYYVTYATNADFSNAVTKKTSKTTLTLSKLQAGTTYYYKVTAYDNAKNESASSALSSFYVKDVTPPSKPSMQVKEVSDNVYLVTWKTPKDNVGIAGYEVLCENAAGETVHSWQTAESSVNLTLPNAGSYTFRLSAYDASGNVSSEAVKKINVKNDLLLSYSSASDLNLNFGRETERSLGLAAV